MCEEHATESEAETPESLKEMFYIFFKFGVLTNFTEGFRNESCLF